MQYVNTGREERLRILCSCFYRYPSGLRGVRVVSMGLVQRQMWRLWSAAPHPLCHNAPCQQRRRLPPVGRGEEVHPGQLFMTKPGQEGEEGEEEQEKEE